ncbi:MAG TPA: UxaA family hydrolase [Chloroflexota bacterium]|nr:UxaA family hydrolase [Chloroflexota bacterium]
MASLASAENSSAADGGGAAAGEFWGYVRPGGRVGVRNYVAVLPSGFVADQVCRVVPRTRTFVTDFGSGHTKRDDAAFRRILVGFGRNPNVSAVVLTNGSRELADAIEAGGGPPVTLLSPKELGGTFGLVAAATEAARRLVHESSRLRREPIPAGRLTLAVKCGSSDATSGIAGNPSVGIAFDRLVACGGTALFGETTELIGAEHLVARRCATPDVAERLLKAVETVEGRALSTGIDIRGVNPMASNIAGGITTIEEKSLGAIKKAGAAPIQGVLEYGEPPPSGKPGLYFVDNWQHANSIQLGYAAAGAHLIIYQLGGVGTPPGALLTPSAGPVAPLLWATANPTTARNAPTSIDFTSAPVIEGREAVAQAGERLWRLLLDVASGALLWSETVTYTPPATVYVQDPVF